MTSVRDVITQFNTGNMLSAANQAKNPDSDQYVFYNRAGFLDTDVPPMLSSIRETVVTNEAGLRLNGDSQILASQAATDYFSTNTTLLPLAVDPRRLLIRASGQSANHVLTLPGPTVLLQYLKNYYGAENITAGTCWKVIFLNDNGAAAPGFTMTLRLPVVVAPEVVLSFGFTAGDRVIAQKTSCELLFMIRSVTPGSESVAYYAL